MIGEHEISLTPVRPDPIEQVRPGITPEEVKVFMDNTTLDQ